MALHGTEKQIIEQIQRRPAGGIMTDENRFDYGYVLSILNQVRADVISERFRVNGRVNDLWLQEYSPTYDVNIQYDPSCVVDFLCPTVINAGLRDGFEYVGNQKGTKEFLRYGRGGGTSVFAQHSRTNKVNQIKWDYRINESGQGVIRFWNNTALRSPLIRAVFYNPNDVPTYRPDKDPYPCTPELLLLIEDRIFSTNTSLTLRTYKDNKSDSQVTNTIMP